MRTGKDLLKTLDGRSKEMHEHKICNALLQAPYIAYKAFDGYAVLPEYDSAPKFSYPVHVECDPYLSKERHCTCYKRNAQRKFNDGFHHIFSNQTARIEKKQ
jgi:hypothetical protein